MPTLKAPTNYIAFDDRGRAILAGTTIKIIELALNHLAHGWSAEEIFFQHGRRFSLAQIHAALAYYYENQTEYDAEIQQQLREVEELRRQAGESPFVKRLKAEGKIV